MLVTLEEAKQHLRVDSDDEDTLIQAYVNAAEQYCLDVCNRTDVPEGAELVFKQATLLVVGQWHRNRMSVSAGGMGGEMPHTVSALINRHRLRNI